jgi:hypothetical protein
MPLVMRGVEARKSILQKCFPSIMMQAEVKFFRFGKISMRCAEESGAIELQKRHRAFVL